MFIPRQPCWMMRTVDFFDSNSVLKVSIRTILGIVDHPGSKSILCGKWELQYDLVFIALGDCTHVPADL
jgi:hypothetical protein